MAGEKRSRPKWQKPEDPEAPYDRAFRPIALEIGFFLREWNDLQEILLLLFHNFAGFANPSGDTRMTQAIWHSVNNDRLQRNMLLRAAEAACLGALWVGAPKDQKFRDHLYGEIKWLVERANALGQQRDDVVHSPVAPEFGERSTLTYVAFALSGHPRASNLKGKKLIKEFRLCRERAKALYAYAHEWLHYGSMGFLGPLPERPEWPNHPPGLKAKSHQQGAKPKAQPRLPRSSQG